MSKLNQELIEKVRNGAIIKHTCKKEDNELLVNVLKACFENCGIPKGEEFNFQYYGKHINNDWDYVFTPKIGAEIIPIHDFFTEEKAEVISGLTENDHARIAAIEKDLLKLKLMPHNNWLPNTCLKNCGSTNCKDKCIYSVFWEDNAPIAPVEPNTIAQTEWKPSVGEWVWIRAENKRLYLIESLNNGHFKLNNQNEGVDWVGEEYIYFTKPIPEEIQSHLTKIAEQRYPVGTKVKELDTEVEYTVIPTFSYNSYLGVLTCKTPEEEWDKGHSNPAIWKNGKWASILEVEPIKEERWKVEVYNPNITGNEGFKINIEPTFKLRELKAIEIADKIKQLLKEL